MGNDLEVNKADLRKSVKKELALISNEELMHLSSLLSKNLASFLRSSRFTTNTLGGFFPIQKEPHWFLSILTQYKFCFPAYVNGKMKFYESKIEDLKEKLDFNFPTFVPDTDGTEIIPELMVIPGLLFTKQGERLGRGKGFFDRYLENYEGIKIAVGFDLQIADQLPTEKHDIIMDYIITEKEIVHVKGVL